MLQKTVQGTVDINISNNNSTQTENPNAQHRKKRNHTIVWVLLVIGLVILIIAAIQIFLIDEDYFDTCTKSSEALLDYPGVETSTFYSPDILEEELNTTDLLIVSRKSWGALPPKKAELLLAPAKYVVYCHTGGRFCKTSSNCTMIVNYIQEYYLSLPTEADIPYNFLIGDDGYIYEGRGWHYQNKILPNSISIGFIGNFLYDFLSPKMIENTLNLTKFGVEISALDEDYRAVCHNQTKNTVSPGKNAYKDIITWPNYSSELIV